jgi:hypothetical protein
MQKQMHVRVNQAGHQSYITQIDSFRSGGTRYVRTSFADSLADYQHLAGRHYFSAFNVQQAGGMQDGRVRRSLSQSREHNNETGKQKAIDHNG